MNSTSMVLPAPARKISLPRQNHAARARLSYPFEKERTNTHNPNSLKASHGTNAKIALKRGARARTASPSEARWKEEVCLMRRSELGKLHLTGKQERVDKAMPFADNE